MKYDNWYLGNVFVTLYRLYKGFCISAILCTIVQGDWKVNFHCIVQLFSINYMYILQTLRGNNISTARKLREKIYIFAYIWQTEKRKWS